MVPGAAMAQAAPGGGTKASPPIAPVGPTTSCVVTRISDGDTLRCRQGRENLRVRLTGIDAPELADSTHGPRSASALRAMAGVGDTLLLEADVSPRDQYGRVLAYAWRNGSMLNLRMGARRLGVAVYRAAERPVRSQHSGGAARRASAGSRPLGYGRLRLHPGAVPAGQLWTLRLATHDGSNRNHDD